MLIIFGLISGLKCKNKTVKVLNISYKIQFATPEKKTLEDVIPAFFFLFIT